MTGEEIFSRIKACDKEQGSIHNVCDCSDEEHNEEAGKNIESERLFGVIWSSELAHTVDA